MARTAQCHTERATSERCNKKELSLTARRRGTRAHGWGQLWPQQLQNGPCLSPPSGQGGQYASTGCASKMTPADRPHVSEESIHRLDGRRRRGILADQEAAESAPGLRMSMPGPTGGGHRSGSSCRPWRTPDVQARDTRSPPADHGFRRHLPLHLPEMGYDVLAPLTDRLHAHRVRNTAHLYQAHDLVRSDVGQFPYAGERLASRAVGVVGVGASNVWGSAGTPASYLSFRTVSSTARSPPCADMSRLGGGASAYQWRPDSTNYC